MHVEKKKLELFLLVWCRLYVGRQTFTIFQGATAFLTFLSLLYFSFFYLISLVNPICGKYSLHGQFNTDYIWCKRSFT